MVRRDPETTRRELLEAAFEEMYEHGFQATGIDQILARTGLTRGALYHHFKNKQELGYAVFDEVIRPWMARTWMTGLETSDDPLTALGEKMRGAMEVLPERFLKRGCPLNNLTQEMAQVDEGFGERIESLLHDWRGTIAAALRRGVETGTVRPDLDVEATAAFLIAGWEGMAGMAKGTGDAALLTRMGGVMERYLEGLRPEGVTAGAGA